MNDEINKEETTITEGGKKKKYKISILDFLPISIIIPAVALYLADSYGGKDSFGLFALVIMLAFSVVITIVPLIYGITSIVKNVKDKRSLMPPEKSKRNKSLIIDIFFFVFLPVVVLFFSFLASLGYFTMLFLSILIDILIIIASGIRLLDKNKEGNRWSRASGWFLIIIAVLIPFSPFLLYLFIL